MRRFLYSLTVLGTLWLLVTPAQGQGILFVQKETRGGQTTNTQIQMDKDHIRVESRASGDESAFVFDTQKQTARMINITKKTYTEMTKSDLDQMQNQTNSAMAQMQEQMRGLPPDQRALMEQMMRGRGLPGAAPAAPKVEYRQTGSDKVGQWTCTKYEGTVGGQKTTEVCTVDPKEFGMAAADFEAARQLSQFMKSMLPNSTESVFVNGTAQDQGFSGVPVRRTSFRNGAVESVTEITETRRQAFPATTFDAPAGFRKEAMPGGARRGN
jgi:hypothetical protein